MDADAITIRPLAPTDSLDELTELLHRAYAALAERGMRYTASHQSVEVTQRRIARGECFVAECAGRLVGTILVVPPDRAPGREDPALYGEPDVAHFHQFGIEPELRASGLGSRLLARVEERARELGALRVACDTSEHAHDLIAWYGRRGYEIVGRADWRPHVNYESVLLAKRLPV